MQRSNPLTLLYDGLIVVLALVFAVLFAMQIPTVARGETIRIALPWVDFLDVNLSFYIDGLSLLFALIISGVGVFVALYSGSYLAGHRQLGRFRLYLMLFMMSMLGLVMSDNLVLLFVFWELTTITSYLLIGFEHETAQGRRSARQALLVTGGGGLAMMAGFVLLATAGGNWELSHLLTQGQAIRDHALYMPILILVLCGAFTKSAQYPFHFWLPNAMAAPTPVSAYLHSATMVKGGIYLMARLYPVLGGTPSWMVILTVFGAITAVWGSIVALRQNDMKLVLAYTTLMALGTLTMLLGTDNVVAITGMLTFLLVHSLYKSSLFLIVGAIDHECGTRKLNELGALAGKMPITMVAAAAAALSMAGIPPFLGFVSKEMIYGGAITLKNMSQFTTVSALAANLLMVGIAAVLIIRPFFGPAVATPKKPHEAPLRMWLGPAILAALGLVLGVTASSTGHWLILPAVQAVMNSPQEIHLALFHGFNTPLILSAVTIALGIGVYLSYRPLNGVLAKLESFIPVTGDKMYDHALNGIAKISHWQTDLFQNGSMHRYLATVFAVIAVSVGYTLLAKGGIVWPDVWPQLRFYEWVVVLLILASTVVTLLAQSRLVAISALGVIGSCVGLIYLMYGAPDVALTQVTVEILVVVLVTVALLKLPGHASVAEPSGSERFGRGIIAILVGSVFTFLLLAVNSLPLDMKLAEYFATNSLALAHGRNIVNVVLVDFRGFDTLGEITVLTVAGITAYHMIKLRLGRSGK